MEHLNSESQLMCMSEITNNPFSSLLPPKVCSQYNHFELSSEGSYHKTLSAKSNLNNKSYSIRVLDTTSELFKQNRNLTKTLFMQEVLHFTLRNRRNDIVLIEDFEIFEDKIAFVTSPCIVLSQINGANAVNLEKMMRDTISDLAFLQTKLNISELLINTNFIYYSTESSNYFIGDWSQDIKYDQRDLLPRTETSRDFENILRLWDSNEEYFDISAESVKPLESLVFGVLRLCGLEHEEWEGLATAKNITHYYTMVEEICNILEKLRQPLRVQKLISKMLKSSFYAKPKPNPFHQKALTNAVSGNPQQGNSMECELTRELPAKLAWCSRQSNFISIGGMQTKGISNSFKGAKLKNYLDAYTLLDRLAGSNLLISTIMNMGTADFEIIDYSNELRSVYHFGARPGRIWDFSSNAQTRLVAIPSLEGAVSHYLFDWTSLKIVRRSKWPDILEGCIEGLDFNPDGKLLSLLDSCGNLLILNALNDKIVYNMQTTESLNDSLNRCRWNPNTNQIAVKIDFNKINLIDTEKFTKLYKEQASLDEFGNGLPWIDWRNDGNLLACASDGGEVNIFDQREGAIVNSFKNLHSDGVRCVKWSPCGNYLASGSADGTAKLTCFKSAEVIYSGRTLDGDWASSICFI